MHSCSVCGTTRQRTFACWPCAIALLYYTESYDELCKLPDSALWSRRMRLHARLDYWASRLDELRKRNPNHAPTKEAQRPDSPRPQEEAHTALRS